MFKPTTPPESLDKNQFVVTSGMPGSGKTYFPVFTGIEPIAFWGFDPNYKSTVDRALIEGIEVWQDHEKGEVYEWCSERPERIEREKKTSTGKTMKEYLIDQDGCRRMVERFEASLQTSLGDERIRTLVIDGVDQLYELYRGAEFGRLSGEPQRNYGAVKAKFRAMLSSMKSIEGCDKHVFVTSHRKEIWKKGSDGQDHGTGEYKVAGFPGIESFADICLLHQIEGNIPVVYVTTQCKQNIALIGESYRGDECNYGTIYADIWGEDPE